MSRIYASTCAMCHNVEWLPCPGMLLTQQLSPQGVGEFYGDMRGVIAIRVLRGAVILLCKYPEAATTSDSYNSDSRTCRFLAIFCVIGCSFPSPQPPIVPVTSSSSAIVRSASSSLPLSS